MSESDLPQEESETEDREYEAQIHPLGAGIEAAKNDDTVSLEELFLD